MNQKMSELESSPRVLIATPINEIKTYCWNEFIDAISKTHHDFLLVDNSKGMIFGKLLEEKAKTLPEDGTIWDYTTRKDWPERSMDRLCLARNKIIWYALAHDYDYLLFVDSDIIVPPDIVERLLAHNKEVVAAVYHTIGKDEEPRVVHNIETESAYEPMPLSYIGSGLRKACHVGFGCTLIQVSPLLESLTIRCERDKNGRVITGEDFCFSNDVYISKGIDLWVDTDIQVKHRVNEVWDWNLA